MRQRLGQHFLDRQSILEQIAKAAAPEQEPLIVEIGPGKGALTAHLLERADRVVAIEVDPYLIGYLRQKFREAIEAGRLEIVESDVLKVDLGKWGPAVIAGNLPYYIASPILDRVFAAVSASTSPIWTRGVFLVQLEVAKRLTAVPGTRDYGYLSVTTQVHAGAKLLFEVSRTAFRPPPKVESAVVSLTPLPTSEETAAFLSFAATCFRQKRKTLRNNLLVRYPKELVNRVAADKLRAEQLSIEQLREIHSKLLRSASAAEPALS